MDSLSNVDSFFNVNLLSNVVDLHLMHRFIVIFFTTLIFFYIFVDSNMFHFIRIFIPNHILPLSYIILLTLFSYKFTSILLITFFLSIFLTSVPSEPFFIFLNFHLFRDLLIQFFFNLLLLFLFKKISHPFFYFVS